MVVVNNEPVLCTGQDAHSVRGVVAQDVLMAQHASVVDLCLVVPAGLINGRESLDRHVLIQPLATPDFTKSTFAWGNKNVCRSE